MVSWASDNLGLRNRLGLTLSMTSSCAVAQWSPQQPCRTKRGSHCSPLQSGHPGSNNQIVAEAEFELLTV